MATQTLTKKDNGQTKQTQAVATTPAPESRAIQAPNLGGAPQAAVGRMGVEIQDLQTMWWLSCRVAGSNLTPKDCRTAEDVFVRAQCGMAAGLNFMQSLQYVANVHGRPAIWGPALKGLILASGKVKSWEESFENPDDPFSDEFAAVIRTERIDIPGVHEIRFSTRMAKRAGLMARDTYKQYPEDMILNRAVGRAAKRVFPDVIGGLIPAEDGGDIIDIPAQVILDHDTPQGKPKTLDELVERRAKAQTTEPTKPQDAPGDDLDPDVDPETGEVLNAAPEPTEPQDDAGPGTDPDDQGVMF